MKEYDTWTLDRVNTYGHFGEIYPFPTKDQVRGIISYKGLIFNQPIPRYRDCSWWWHWGIPYYYFRNGVNGKLGRDVISATNYLAGLQFMQFLPTILINEETHLWEDDYQWVSKQGDDRGIYAVRHIYATIPCSFNSSLWNNRPGWEEWDEYDLEEGPDLVAYRTKMNPKCENKWTLLDKFCFSDSDGIQDNMKVYTIGVPGARFLMMDSRRKKLYKFRLVDGMKKAEKYRNPVQVWYHHDYHFDEVTTFQSNKWDKDDTFSFKTSKLDNFSIDNNLDIGCIHFHTVGWNAQLILGSENVLRNHRPVVFGYVNLLDNFIHDTNSLQKMFDLFMDCSYVITTTDGQRYTEDLEEFYDAIPSLRGHVLVMIPKEEYELFRDFGDCWTRENETGVKKLNMKKYKELSGGLVLDISDNHVSHLDFGGRY